MPVTSRGQLHQLPILINVAHAAIWGSDGRESRKKNGCASSYRLHVRHLVNCKYLHKISGSYFKVGDRSRADWTFRSRNDVFLVVLRR